MEAVNGARPGGSGTDTSPWAPRGTRASVTWGRQRRRSGSISPAPASAPATSSCRPAAPPPGSARSSASTRGRPLGQRRHRTRLERHFTMPAGAGAHRLADRPEPLGVHRAQEDERHVQGLLGHEPQPLVRAQPRAGPGRQLGPRPVGQVQRHEQARAGVAQARSRTRPSSTRSMCIATVVERSRISAAVAGQAHLARQLVPAGGARAPAHGAHGLLFAAPARAGHPGDGDRHVHPVAGQRPLGHRRGHLGRHRAVALDQRPGPRPAGPPWPRWRSSPCRRSRRPKSPAARSAGPPAGRRCTTRRWRSYARPAAPPPGRPPTSRRWRTACRRGARRSAPPAPARPPRPRGSWRTTTSTSPRRRQVVTSSRSRPWICALGHPQGLRDLGLGDAEQPQHGLLVVGALADRRAEGLGRHRGGPHGLQLARGPGQHHHRGARAPAGGTTIPGAVPAGSRMVAPSGTIACLRLAVRMASWSRLGQRRMSGAQDLGDPALQGLVQGQRAPG